MSGEMEEWQRSAQAGFSTRSGRSPRILTSLWGGGFNQRNNSNNFGGLGHGPYDNTLAANIAAGSRLVNVAPPGHWPREVSYWSLSSSSSSSSSEYEIDDDDNRSQDSNGNPKPRPRRKRKGKGNTGDDDDDDDVEEVIWKPESQRNSVNLGPGPGPKTSSQEVIYDLDERAMSKLPDHLQHNMREMQQERVERLQRENKSVPIRRFSDFRRERWFKTLVQRLPATSSRSSAVYSTGSHDTDYTQTRPGHSEDQGQGQEQGEQEEEEDPDIIRPVCPGDVHEAYYEDTTGEHHGNVPGWYRRVGNARGRRVHRASSTKDTSTFGHGSSGGSHLNEGPRRSEPCLSLPYLRQPDENSIAISQTCPKQDVDDHEQHQEQTQQRQVAAEELEALPRVQKKRSLFFRPIGVRARVKKSIYKLSKAFKKG